MQNTFPARQASSSRNAFTLVEMLVVVGIIAVMAIVSIISLDPAQLILQSRDARRFSDIANIQLAVGAYISDQSASSLATASTTYISVPDASATSTAGDQCQGLGVPSSTYAWQCASPSNYRNINGTGWVPINFSAMSYGSPIANLPVDPMNQSSSGLYYTFQSSGIQYEITALMESQKYKSQLATAPVIAQYPEVDAVGNNLTLSGLWNSSGLGGYWNFEEGSGTTAFDQSGNGSNGTWTGTLPHYASNAKVGNYSANFDGATDYVGTTNQTCNANESIAMWVYPSVQGGNGTLFDFHGCTGRITVYFSSSDVFSLYPYSASSYRTSKTYTTGSWHFLVLTMQGSGNVASIYVDGSLDMTSSSIAFFNTSSSPTAIYMGSVAGPGNYYNGIIDDARVYSRVLSAAEVQSLYNAEK